ncbi:fimbrial biogenesis chaperone [Paraburkholderia bannensis]|uniref:fimbrial biogenesis chaperone n=1 Tax=Paraburkholderia bannensis TaxID=765414 RepID=UPI002ABD44CD|nr:fimbria/pilus periplasmic chaperone [Paraburkholderia bannensis]
MGALFRSCLSGILIFNLEAAFPASLEITPVSVELDASQNGQVLTLRNSGTQALYAQVRIYAWNQAAGDEQLTPTRDLVASPPIAPIPPGGAQIVRLMRAGQASSPREMSYRLFIDELPAENTTATSSVQFRFRYSVPVFLYPAGERGAPDTHWSLETRDGKWLLNVSNSGALHARISDVTLTGAGVRVPVHTGLLGYALAGRERAWRVAAPPPSWRGGDARLDATANINGKLVTTPVAFEP